MGDANLCSIKWYEVDHYLHDQAAMVQSFLLDESCSQLFKNYTRSEIVQGEALSRSCKDHCYTNVPEKLSTPEVTKYTRSQTQNSHNKSRYYSVQLLT